MKAQNPYNIRNYIKPLKLTFTNTSQIVGTTHVTKPIIVIFLF